MSKKQKIVFISLIAVATILLATSILLLVLYTDTSNSLKKKNKELENTKVELERVGENAMNYYDEWKEAESESDIYQTSYEDLLEDYETLEEDYNDLNDDYDDLENDYDELLELYKEETKVVVETPEDLSDYDSTVKYDNLARTPDNYEGKALSFTGEVIQVSEFEDEVDLRVIVNDDYDSVIMCVYEPDIVEKRILEGDTITFYGISYGNITYESVMAGYVTVPLIWADYVVLK